MLDRYQKNVPTQASPGVQGFDTSKKAVVIGATNRKADLDAALLSRFDLLFLLLDQVTESSDMALARHVTTVHKTLKAPQ